jgi:hypothetical protein
MWRRRSSQTVLVAMVVAFGVFDPWMAVRRRELIVSMSVVVGLLMVHAMATHHLGHRDGAPLEARVRQGLVSSRRPSSTR